MDQYHCSAERWLNARVRGWFLTTHRELIEFIIATVLLWLLMMVAISELEIAKVYEGQRFDLRFLRPFRADLSIKKSSSFFPPLIAATSQSGLAPRPAQVSPDGLRYFGGTFFPFKTLPPPRTALLPPATAIAPSILSICFCISARCSRSISSTRFRRSMSASTVIPDRLTFAIVISSPKTV